MDSANVTTINKKKCRDLLTKLISDSAVFDTVLISNEDGLLLAGLGKSVELHLMAAISTSVLSLADKLTSSSSEKLIIESMDHSLVVLHVKGLILTVIGTSSSNAAMVLASGNQIAKKITAIMFDESTVEPVPS